MYLGVEHVRSAEIAEIAEVGLQTKNAKQVQHHEVAGVKMTIFPSTTFNVPFATCRASVSFKSISRGYQQHQVLAASGQTARALNLRWSEKKWNIPS